MRATLSKCRTYTHALGAWALAGVQPRLCSDLGDQATVSLPDVTAIQSFTSKIIKVLLLRSCLLAAQAGGLASVATDSFQGMTTVGICIALTGQQVSDVS